MTAHVKTNAMVTPQLVLNVGITVATIALGWGVITTKQSAQEAQIQELKQNTVSKEKVEALLILMREMKENIQDVRNDIKDLKKSTEIINRRARMENANQ